MPISKDRSAFFHIFPLLVALTLCGSSDRALDAQDDDVRGKDVRGKVDARDEVAVETGSAESSDDMAAGYWSGMPSRFRSSLFESNDPSVPDEALVRPSLLRWNRVLHSTLQLPDWVDLAVAHRTRFESVSHPWRAGQTGSTDSQLPIQHRLRLGLRRGPFELLFEGQESRTFLDGTGSFSGGAVENRADVLQLFGAASFTELTPAKLNADVHLGRFSLDISSKRLVGRNGYPNNTNSFQGAHVSFGVPKEWRLRAFSVSPVTRRVLKPDRGSSEQLFWGSVFEYRGLDWLDADAYYLGLSDRRAASSAGFREFSTFGTRLYRAPAKAKQLEAAGIGVFDYDLEATLQTGRSRAQDLLAYLFHAEAGWTFAAPLHPRLALELDYASGDDDPTDSDNRRFDPLFGLRRPALNTTSIFGPFRFSNIQSFGGRVQVSPHQSLKVQLRYRVWYLAEARDAFAGSRIGSAASLQDPTGSAGDSLGQTLELAGTWKFTTNLSFEAGYAHWFKGSYFDRLPAGAGLPQGGNKDTDYVFAQTTIRF